MSDCHDDHAMPAVAEVMRDIPEEDEGDAEQSSLQRLMRVHRNLDQPPNRLLAHILKEAKAPASVVDLASQLQCPLCARHVRTYPCQTCTSFPIKRTWTNRRNGFELSHCSQSGETHDSPLRGRGIQVLRRNRFSDRHVAPITLS